MSRKEPNGVKEQTIAVQRTQDYIGENLTKEITLSDLARTSFFLPGIPTAYSGSTWA